MEKKRTYKVAGLSFSFQLPEVLDNEAFLQAYAPFATDGDEDELFCLSVRRAGEVQDHDFRLLGNEEAPYLWISERGDGKTPLIGHSLDKVQPKAVLDTEDCTLCFIPGTRKAEAIMSINNSLMLLYALHAGYHDTLLLHASTIVRQEKGYVFLGKSGTGKSTHSRMWLENLDGCVLLNDDNPAVRLISGQPVVFGTPWSGKTPCYKNASAPLGGIVRIVRAPHNKAVRLSPIEAFASLMPACSSMLWDGKWIDIQQKTIEAAVMATPSWNMECLPNGDAAIVCSSAVETNTNGALR